MLVAIDALFRADLDLLKRDVAERSIASRLAHHLAQHFVGQHIDVEYNRDGDDPKRVRWKGEPSEVLPDIIIHRRGTRDNILAIELKKESNAESSDDDIEKLKAYRRDLHYTYALFLRLGVGTAAGAITDCEWVNP